MNRRVADDNGPNASDSTNGLVSVRRKGIISRNQLEVSAITSQKFATELLLTVTVRKKCRKRERMEAAWRARGVAI